MKKLSNTEAEFKKSVAYKKNVYCNKMMNPQAAYKFAVETF